MRHPILSVVLLSSLATFAACSSSPPPATTTPPPVATTTTPPVATTETTTATASATPTEPTPEEKKKAEEAKALADDRAKWETDSKAELARWTPELHAAGKALADKTFASGKAAIQAAMAGSHRVTGAAARDKFRHPVETLDFFDFKPTMTVLDIGPGEGWYTELLAPALAKKGKYVATNNDPNGPADIRPTFYGQRFKAFLDKAPELFGKVETIIVDGKAPKLGADASTDLVLIMRGVHGMANGGTFGAWLAEIHRTLKPGGVLGIEEHRAKPDADVVESAKKGYVPEKWVIEQAEAAGFKLVGKSEINANPKDTKDHPEGVWSLPPTLREKDKDKDKYLAIGESDRMTLKFVKVAAKPAAKKP
ncbi:MAG: methyltransferase domain-containing protein [Polyangiales bacterium]